LAQQSAGSLLPGQHLVGYPQTARYVAYSE